MATAPDLTHVQPLGFFTERLAAADPKVAAAIKAELPAVETAEREAGAEGDGDVGLELGVEEADRPAGARHRAVRRTNERPRGATEPNRTAAGVA